MCYIRRSESASIFGTNEVICRAIWRHLSSLPYQFSIFDDEGSWQHWKCLLRPNLEQSKSTSFLWQKYHRNFLCYFEQARVILSFVFAANYVVIWKPLIPSEFAKRTARYNEFCCKGLCQKLAGGRGGGNFKFGFGNEMTHPCNGSEIG